MAPKKKGVDRREKESCGPGNPSGSRVSCFRKTAAAAGGQTMSAGWGAGRVQPHGWNSREMDSDAIPQTHLSYTILLLPLNNENKMESTLRRSKATSPCIMKDTK